MTDAEALAVIRSVCGAKTRWAGPAPARRAAAHIRNEKLYAYRCPFSAERHWHIGHYPSLPQLQRIADVIRWRAQGGEL